MPAGHSAKVRDAAKGGFAIRNEGYELVSVDALKRHPKNPRRGDVEAIASSIAHNGFYGAVVVQRSTGHILAGYHRYEAAKRAGATEVPVLWVDVDNRTARRILLADNRTNDLASYDEIALAELLDTARTEGDLAGTAYDGAAVDKLLEDLANAHDSGEEGAAQPQLGAVQYTIVVACKDEVHQAEVLARLESEGLDCKPLMS
jgi:ParB-like chromosome segregation protein Spo0J